MSDPCPLAVAVCQMDCREGARAHNRSLVEASAAQAVARGATLLALPELWSSGYDLAAASVDPEDPEQEFTFLVDLARRSGLSVMGGSLLERGPDGELRNCAPACDATGERMRYRKLHRFGPLGEDRYLAAGATAPLPFELAGWRCGVAICYDLRFPELFRWLVGTEGLDVLFVPAQWPRARIGHWRALLVARAIENQCFVVGINRCGWFGELEFPGHSLVIDPWGQMLLDAGEEPGLHIVMLEGAAVAQARARLPVLRDRRVDVFPVRAR